MAASGRDERRWRRAARRAERRRRLRESARRRRSGESGRLLLGAAAFVAWFGVSLVGVNLLEGPMTRIGLILPAPASVLEAGSMDARGFEAEPSERPATRPDGEAFWIEVANVTRSPEDYAQEPGALVRVNDNYDNGQVWSSSGSGHYKEEPIIDWNQINLSYEDHDLIEVRITVPDEQSAEGKQLVFGQPGGEESLTGGGVALGEEPPEPAPDDGVIRLWLPAGEHNKGQLLNVPISLEDLFQGGGGGDFTLGEPKGGGEATIWVEGLTVGTSGLRIITEEVEEEFTLGEPMEEEVDAIRIQVVQLKIASPKPIFAYDTGIVFQLAHQIDGDVTCFWDFDDRVIGSGVQEGSHSSIQTGTTAQVRYSASASSGNSTTDTIQLVENEDNRRAVFRVEVTVDAEGESPLLGQSGSSITMARDIRVALSEIVGPALESTSDPVEMVENLHSIRNLASSAYDAMHNVYPATGANHPFFWTELTQEEVDGNADNMNGLEAGDGEGQYRLLVTSGGGPGEFAARAVTFTTGISTTGSACVYAVFLSDHFWTSSEEPNVASTHIISAIVDHEEKHVYQLADTRENGDTFWHRLFKDLFSGGTQDYTQFWEAEGSTAELSSEIDWFWATPSNPFGSIVAQLKIKYEAALVELNNISSGAVKTESEVFLRNLYASFPGWFRLSHLDPMFVDLLYIRPPS